MKYWFSFFLYFFFTCLIFHGRADAFVVAAYYENWSSFREDRWNREAFSPSMIDSSLLSDLYFAFAVFGFVTDSIDPTHPHLTGDFTIQPIYSDDQSVLYKEFQQLKKHAASKLKTLLSIGRANFNHPGDHYGMGKYTYTLFSQMVSTPENRRQFIESAVEYTHKYGFDGIEIDWEYPGDLTRGGKPEDFTHFIEFLKECFAAFHSTTPSLILSFAAPACVPGGIPKGYRDHPDQYFRWLAACARHVDRVTVMAYDYHTPDGGEKLTGVNAPLYRDTRPESSLYIAKTLENYLKNGVPANKMLLGLPVYGLSYQGVSDLQQDGNGAGKPFHQPEDRGSATEESGFLSYFEITDLIAQNQLNWGVDAITNTAFAYNVSKKRWISFDIPETIALKPRVYPYLRQPSFFRHAPTALLSSPNDGGVALVAQLVSTRLKKTAAGDRGRPGVKVKEAKKNNLQGVIFWAVGLDEYQWKPRFPNIRAAHKLKEQKNA